MSLEQTHDVKALCLVSSPPGPGLGTHHPEKQSWSCREGGPLSEAPTAGPSVSLCDGVFLVSRFAVQACLALCYQACAAVGVAHQSPGG